MLDNLNAKGLRLANEAFDRKLDDMASVTPTEEPGEGAMGYAIRAYIKEATRVAGYTFEMRYPGNRWSGRMFSEKINLPAEDVRNVVELREFV